YGIDCTMHLAAIESAHAKTHLFAYVTRVAVRPATRWPWRSSGARAEEPETPRAEHRDSVRDAKLQRGAGSGVRILSYAGRFRSRHPKERNCAQDDRDGAADRYQLSQQYRCVSRWLSRSGLHDMSSWKCEAGDYSAQEVLQPG